MGRAKDQGSGSHIIIAVNIYITGSEGCYIFLK